MKPYPKYKDSGIQWIGQIPEHWHVGKIKFVCDAIFAGATPSTSNPAYWEGGTIPWIPSGCCHDCNINEAPKYITEEGLQHSSTKLIPANTTVMALTGATCALLGYLTFESCANQSVVAFVENKQKANSRYLFYTLFAARQEILSHQSGGAQGGVNQEDCSNIVIPFISLSEQQAIVAYLDDKTSKLDECVRLLELQKADLRDYRKAIISETVTRGLNPNAKLKDSGIQWIGQIPEEWKISKIGWLFSIKAGGDAKRELYSEVRDKEHPYPVYTNSLDKNSVYAYTSKPTCKGNAITVTGRGDIGHAYYRTTPFDAIIRLLVLQPAKDDVDSRYYTYLIDTVIPFHSSSAAVAQLSAEQIAPYLVCFPPHSEQQAIADYLDAKTAKIDETIANIDAQIADLRDYRSALISDVVTGKIDVRNN